MSKHKPKPIEYTCRHLAMAAVSDQPLARKMIAENRSLLASGEVAGRESALAEVVIENHLGAAKFLLECGAEVNGRESFGSTPLMYAAQLGYLEMVKLLLVFGAEVNVIDEICEDTPLRFAAHYGYPEVCDVLLAAGADIELRGEFERPIFSHFHARKYSQLVEVFKKHGHPEPPWKPWPYES